jgi:TetR/AcrR family transcriptional regulator, transcriptional repressor of bet genes
VNKE